MQDKASLLKYRIRNCGNSDKPKDCDYYVKQILTGKDKKRAKALIWTEKIVAKNY